MKNLPNINPVKALKASLPYLIAGLLCTKLGEAYRLTTGGDVIDRLLAAFTKLGLVFQNPLPSLHPFDLLVGAVAAVLLRLVVWSKIKNAKKYRHGEEYGTARWGTAKDIEPYVDPVFENNLLLTQTERLMMSGRPKQPKYARNKNVLVIGGSGSGKTRFYLKPNLMQMHSSYVITDPKGTVLVECGKMLQKGKYRIKVLNTINFSKSMRYNPFSYIRSEKDILKLVNTIITNTKGEGQQSGEDFWVKAEKLYYTALIAYIWYEAPEEEQNFAMLIDLIDASEAREDDENFKNPVDLLFDELEEKVDDIFENAEIFEEENKNIYNDEEKYENINFDIPKKSYAEENIYINKDIFENFESIEEKRNTDFNEFLKNIYYKNYEKAGDESSFFYESTKNNNTEYFDGSTENNSKNILEEEKSLYDTKNIFGGKEENIKNFSSEDKNISVSVTNNVSITKECDIDDVIEQLCEKISDAVEAAGEGRHI